ncbi:MAG: aminotransferase class V-fold PLP-dependent enzyme, partial [Gammaproteobacteria bacterium]|nr:aminotransferase class V-fold PLP-dependent enzyme [Gammaproteobacteria bacterium]
ALCNTLSRGDEILVLESGRFAPGWGQMGEALGLCVSTLDGPPRAAVDPDQVETLLRADTAGRIKAVLVVHVDTATGVVNDLPAIRSALDAAGHDALLLVDAVASLACLPFAMDEWGVDLAIAASQKGLMAPPGLSFCAAGPRARRAHDSADLKTRYWDWTEREGPEHYQKYCGTPPEHMLFALDQALRLIREEGLEAVFRRHRLLAGAVRSAVSTWGEAGAFEFNIRNAAERADSVTVVRMRDDLDPAPLLEFCREVCGLTLGIGIGELRG